MTDREPRTVRVDAELWDRFEEYVARTTGKKQGAKAEHMESALREYLNHDRYATIEDMVRDLHTHVLDEPADTHTQTQTETSATVERTRLIAERIHENHESPLPKSDVHRAITDIAGGDPRTIAKYERELKQRQLLYEHPSDSGVWTADRDEWAGWVDNYTDAVPDANYIDIIGDYGIEADEFERLDGVTVDE